MPINFTPNFEEAMALKAFVFDLGFGESTEFGLDLKDGTGGPYDWLDFHVDYVCGDGSTDDGIRFDLYANSNPDATGALAEGYQATEPIWSGGGFLWDVGTDVQSTTLSAEAASAQKVVNVTSATGFAVGQRVIFDPGNGGGTQEIGTIAAIDSNELTMVNNLVNTQASGEVIKTIQRRVFRFQVGATTYVTGRVTNVATAGADVGIRVEATGRRGYTTENTPA